MKSISKLLQHIVDYAGLFPPAKLDMQSTVKNYARYINSDDAWMLSRLIVPVARLDEFEECAEGYLPNVEDKQPWRISALTVAAGDDALDTNFERIHRFNGDYSGTVIIDAIELRATNSNEIDDALDLLDEDITPYFELPLTEDLRGMISALAGTDAGAKARTGGITPDLFPSPCNLARFINNCALASVPFKATAGLHHPIRHNSKGVAGAKEYGFFNIFIGAALSMRNSIDEETLAELLADETMDNFTFTEDSIAWKEHTVDLDIIEKTRTNFAVSYGSCSFEEPLVDLRELKLI